MKKILLTGGSGFVGSSILEYFSDTYNILAPSHTELDILSLNHLKTYIKHHNITHVIHAAAINERWYSKATAEHMYKNLLMFENIALAAKECEQLIMFGSGAEFDDGTNIVECKETDIFTTVPSTLGGLVKSIIAKRIHTIYYPKCYYLRFFGGFGYYEQTNRFVKNNLLRIINNQSIEIHQNKWFDFIYIDDIALIIKHILQNDNIPQDINCVYNEKRTLLDIANILLDITKRNVDITIQQDGLGKSYTGNGGLLHQLQLPLVGLESGIQRMYKQLLQEKQ